MGTVLRLYVAEVPIYTLLIYVLILDIGTGQDGNKEDAIVYDDVTVRNLLDRSQEGIEEKNKLLDDYLSSFKVASYIVKEVQQEEEEEVKCHLNTLLVFFENVRLRFAVVELVLLLSKSSSSNIAHAFGNICSH